MKKVYLAGPTVFFPNHAEVFAELHALCKKHNVVGVSPLDGGSADQILNGNSIFRANINKIRACDGVLADMTPFRGEFEPDSGTCFEIGVAFAWAKPVTLYLPDATRSLKDKITERVGSQVVQGDLIDSQYKMIIEDFENPLNLMLAEPYDCFSSAEPALLELIRCMG